MAHREYQAREKRARALCQIKTELLSCALYFFFRFWPLPFTAHPFDEQVQVVFGEF